MRDQHFFLVPFRLDAMTTSKTRHSGCASAFRFTMHQQSASNHTPCASQGSKLGCVKAHRKQTMYEQGGMDAAKIECDPLFRAHVPSLRASPVLWPSNPSAASPKAEASSTKRSSARMGQSRDRPLHSFRRPRAPCSRKTAT